MTICAVVFDLFHTLISLESIGATGRRLCDEFSVPEERWEAFWLLYTDARARGRLRTNVEVLSLMARDLGLPHEPQRWVQIAADRTARFRRALLEVEPDVVPALQALRASGLRLGLLSDADCDEVSAWPDSPLCRCFDAALFSCHEGLRKPELAFYRRLCAKLGVEPHECLYVGDGRSDEHLGARVVGMTPVLMTGHLARFSPERVAMFAPRCDHQVTDVAEVGDLVRRLNHPTT